MGYVQVVMQHLYIYLSLNLRSQLGMRKEKESTIFGPKIYLNPQFLRPQICLETKYLLGPKFIGTQIFGNMNFLGAKIVVVTFF